MHIIYIYKWLPIHTLKNTNSTTVQMLLKYCTCAKRTSWVKRLAGEECKIVFSAWACKHTNIIESFLGLCTQSSVWNVSSANRGECVTTGGLYRPTHLCLAHFELHKKFDSFFLWCGKVRGLGVMVHVSGGRGLFGVSERGGVSWVQGSHSLGGKAVEQSGGAGSDVPVQSSWW